MNCDSRLHLQKESFAGRNNYHFRTQKYRKYSEKSAMAQPGTEVQPLLSLVDQEEEDDAPLFPPTPDEPSETVAPENVAAQTASSDASAHPLASQASAQVPAASVEVVAPIAGGLPAMRFSRSQPAANATAQPFTGGEWTGDTPPTYEQTISGVQPGPSSAPEAPALTALRTPLEVRQRRAKQRRCCFLIFAISVVLLTVILGTMLGLEHSSVCRSLCRKTAKKIVIFSIDDSTVLYMCICCDQNVCIHNTHAAPCCVSQARRTLFKSIIRKCPAICINRALILHKNQPLIQD